MEFEQSDAGLYKVLVVRDKVDQYNILEFKNILYERTSGVNTHVAIELRANVAEVPSIVIGALISGQKKMSGARGVFVLINPSEQIKILFSRAGLQDFFTIVDNVNQLNR